MATFEKQFNTKYTADEMKIYITTNVLPNPALKSVLNDVSWEGNVLRVNSKLGKGTITLKDNLITVFINLTFIGSITKNVLEDTLDKEFKKLNP